MEKAQSAVANQDFSVWPKPSDNENASDVGWLLYSTQAQDEGRLMQLLSQLIGNQIKTMAGGIKKKEDGNPNEKKIRSPH
jgi:hypothetical protein